MKQLSFVFLTLLFLIITGCFSPSVYKMSPAHVPVNTGKNELNVSVNYCAAINGQASYSVTDHIGLAAQYTFYNQAKYKIPDYLLSDTRFTSVNIEQAEGGIYYFTNIARKSKQENYFQLAGLYNKGHQEFNVTDFGEKSSKFRGFAVQPAFYFIRHGYSFYTALKYQHYIFDHFTNKPENKEFMDFPLNSVYLHSGFTGDLGRVGINLQLGVALSNSYNMNKYFWRGNISNDLSEAVFSIGLKYSFNKLNRAYPD